MGLSALSKHNAVAKELGGGGWGGRKKRGGGGGENLKISSEKWKFAG
jgi:hypothetical protein